MSQKPKVKLTGQDGNVFNIISLCKRAAQKAKLPPEQVNEIVRRMMHAGSYDEVLQIAVTEFDVE